jgi:hypothetical protein
VVQGKYLVSKGQYWVVGVTKFKQAMPNIRPKYSQHSWILCSNDNKCFVFDSTYLLLIAGLKVATTLTKNVVCNARATPSPIFPFSTKSFQAPFPDSVSTFLTSDW